MNTNQPITFCSPLGTTSHTLAEILDLKTLLNGMGELKPRSYQSLYQIGGKTYTDDTKIILPKTGQSMLLKEYIENLGELAGINFEPSAANLPISSISASDALQTGIGLLQISDKTSTVSSPSNPVAIKFADMVKGVYSGSSNSHDIVQVLKEIDSLIKENSDLLKIHQWEFSSVIGDEVDIKKIMTGFLQLYHDPVDTLPKLSLSEDERCILGVLYMSCDFIDQEKIKKVVLENKQILFEAMGYLGSMLIEKDANYDTLFDKVDLYLSDLPKSQLHRAMVELLKPCIGKFQIGKPEDFKWFDPVCNWLNKKEQNKVLEDTDRSIYSFTLRGFWAHFPLGTNNTASTDDATSVTPPPPPPPPPQTQYTPEALRWLGRRAGNE